MLYPSLLTVHILSGIFWGGGAILGGRQVPTAA
jgi:hypothetical protein